MSTTPTPIHDIHAEAKAEKMLGAFDALVGLDAQEVQRIAEAVRRHRRGQDGRKMIDTYVDRYRAQLRDSIARFSSESS